jgi:uncharacterized repeat protein (TIGR01451 family)
MIPNNFVRPSRQLPIIFALFCAIAFVLLAVAAMETNAAGQNSLVEGADSGAHITELTLHDQGLSFTLQSPSVHVDSDGRMVAPGLERVIQQPGAPALPYFSTYIVVPPEADISVEVSEKEVVEFSGINVAPVPVLDREAALGASEQGMLAIDNSQTRPIPDPEIYLRDDFFPVDSIRLSPPAYLRDVRVVLLELFPVRHNPLTGRLTHAREMDVLIGFDRPVARADSIPRELAAPFGQATAASLVLNAEQMEQWRGLPAELASTTTALPLDRDLFRIEVDQDGIYEVSYDDLSAAGMDVANVDPATIEMLYRGEPLAYVFFGDSDSMFESGEKLRFFGWTFDGSSHERQFVGNNVYWIWAGGTPTGIPGISASGGAEVSSFQSTVTGEPELVWWPGYTDKWHSMPNDPDPWFWDRVTTGIIVGGETVTRSYQVDLPDPTIGAGQAQFTAEFGSWDGTTSDQLNTVTVTVNDLPMSSTLSWIGERNVNVTGTVPLSSLIDGSNSFEVGYATNGFRADIALNRISVSYQRALVASGDQLFFEDASGGNRQFAIGGFTDGDLAQVILWDVTNPRLPSQILTDTVSVSGSGPYTLTIPTNRPPGSKLLATTTGNVLTPAAISRYTPTPIHPTGGADWVAITHEDFLPEANRLAGHRADPSFGGMRTHVVDVEDILNQYGYGLPLPSAIQDYLIHALATWPIAPGYVTLIGDATLDPRGVLDTWLDKQFVPTDLVFADRWQGQIPSDQTYAMLVGDDLLPDIAVGRIPAQTPDDAAAMIDKIIRFEQNHLQSYSWMENLLFLSDDTDSAGRFCDENQAAADRLPDALNPIQLCLDDYADAETLRGDLFAYANLTGTIFLNYRGHGSINRWAGNPVILSEEHLNEWNNPLKPVVILTGDCLDGHFAYPPIQGLGEVFLRKNGGASTAHWGSAGFGYSTEHSQLIEAFYDGIFLGGKTALGDAINYAKSVYAGGTGHPSVLYGFSLQGDPAMQLMRPELSVSAQAQPGYGRRNETVNILLTASNNGLYPASVTVSNTLPDGMSFLTATASISAGITTSGRNALFDLQFGDDVLNKGLPRNAVAVVTITAQVNHDAAIGKATNIAALAGTGLEAEPGDESVTVDIAIVERSLYLPIALTD